MNPRQLRATGHRLYGHDWQSKLARRLKVHRVTVWRWLSGASPIPEEQAERIRFLESVRAVHYRPLT